MSGMKKILIGRRYNKMGKARNLSVLLAADGQVEDAKIDGPM